MHTGICLNSVWAPCAVSTWRVLPLLLISLALAQPARSQGHIVFAIKAVNPAQTDSTVRVNVALPRGVKPQDVVDAGGMEVKYDPNADLYCVRAEEQLPARGNKEYRVALRDIWIVPPEKISALRTQVSKLTELLSGTRRKDTAVAVRRQIDDGLTQLEKWQDKYRVGPGTTASAHIQAFERSLEILKQAVEDTGILENQAKGEGIDVPETLGPPPPLKARDDRAAGKQTRKIRLEVRNTGRTEQQLPIKKYLPREVSQEDVTADDRLEVRYDPERGSCYLYSPGVAVQPDEPLIIEVIVADKWVVAPERYAYLEMKATNVQARAAECRKEDVADRARQLLNRLAAVRTAERPPFGDEYIAVYHRQVEELDRIEEDILRLDARLTPAPERKIFTASVLEQAEAPSRSTTWIIVFIVIGFLFLFSVLFFLRWYGKSTDETMSE